MQPQRTYTITGDKVNVGNPYKRDAIFVLKYSKIRNKYKIENLGLIVDSSESTAYQKCLDKQIEIENNVGKRI